MDPAELAFAGVSRQVEEIRSGRVSARELTELYLERIRRLDPRINAFRVVMAEKALAEAGAADKRRAGGEEAPLLGVPIAVKDNIDVAGQITTQGTNGFDTPAAADCELVAKLRHAGAIIIGKTNLPELAVCGFTETEAWGKTRNPWDTSRTPGGSSGGSGAAVAAGLVGAAHATDGAGSIRFPAANCNLFGLKPQRDRVTLAPETVHWHGLSMMGFVTHSVRDSALLLDVALSGEQMASAPPPPSRPFTEAAASPPGKLRIAYATKPPRALAPPILEEPNRTALLETAELLGSLGHEVAEQNPDFGLAGSRAVNRYLRGISDELATVPHPERLEARTRGFGRLGRMIPSRVLRKSIEAEGRDRDRIGKVFEDHDVLVMPSTGKPPVEVGRWEGQGALRTLLGMSRVYPYGIIWNHTGQPAAAVPAGFSSGGLPLSVMLVGRPNDEETLLSLAAQIEAERPWADRRPPVS